MAKFRWGVEERDTVLQKIHIPARRLETNVASRVASCLFFPRHLCNSVYGGYHWGGRVQCGPQTHGEQRVRTCWFWAVQPSRLVGYVVEP